MTLNEEIRWVSEEKLKILCFCGHAFLEINRDVDCDKICEYCGSLIHIQRLPDASYTKLELKVIGGKLMKLMRLTYSQFLEGVREVQG